MKPLFILPFDHRGSFARDLLDTSYPVTKSQKAALAELKNIILDGLLYARNRYRGNAELATIIDEEFGAEVIANAKKLRVPFALTTEAAKHTPFAFIHGLRFGAALKRIKPAYAKALVYYTVSDEKLNKPARKKLRALVAFCEKAMLPLMIEVLVDSGSTLHVDVKRRLPKARLMSTMIDEMERDGVKPDIWKLEPVASVAEWQNIARHTKARIIILGHGDAKAKVDAFVKTAAKSGKVDGFAIGRTIFLKPLQRFLAQTVTRKEAVAEIGEMYLHYIRLWEKYA